MENKKPSVQKWIEGFLLYKHTKTNYEESNMAEKQVPKVNVNGTEYNLADLSDEAKVQVQNLRAADAEIRRLNMQMALAKTARNAYIQALQAALPEKKRVNKTTKQ
jgi:hypothetical protein